MADAPAARATEGDDAPAAKRQKLAVTVAAWTPPLVTHTWTIRDVTLESFTCAAPNDEWEGPEFEACGLRWQLNVEPNKVFKKDEDVRGFGTYLRLLDRTLAPVVLTEVALRLDSETVFKEDSLEGPFFNGELGDDYVGPTVFPARGLLVSHSKLAREAERWLARGQMVVTVTLRGRSFAEMAVPKPKAPSLPLEMAAVLLSGVGEQLVPSDVVFKVDGGQSISTHSFILALRSSTLRASLFGPLAAACAPSASQPRELDIPGGIGVAAFRRVLSFIYSDLPPGLRESSPLSVAELHDVLHAADYLDVRRLRELCAAELHARLAPDNAVATLKVAHALSCRPLFEAALRFIAANSAAVMREPGWAELSREHELMQAVFSTMATGEPPVKTREPTPEAAG